LNAELQDLVVRGLRVCGPQHLAPLRAMHQELARVGARHVADRLEKLIAAIEADGSHAAAELLGTQAALRVFERVLTLRFAEAALQDAPSDSCESAARDDAEDPA
jgi:hypothetical protein